MLRIKLLVVCSDMCIIQFTSYIFLVTTTSRQHSPTQWQVGRIAKLALWLCAGPDTAVNH